VAPTPHRPPDAPATACPCRHGNPPAEAADQRLLLERAAGGDREAFGRLYDDQVEGVYRYLLAWTGDRARAEELTGTVLHSALRWLPAAGHQPEAGFWLIAMARDAVQDPTVDPVRPPNPPRDAVEAVGHLRNPEREVVVLRLLCGHSLDHTAHLSGYTRRAVLQLQLAACQTIATLTTASPPGTASPATGEGSPEAFDRHLDPQPGDPRPGDPAADPSLAGALAAAGSLRRAAPGAVAAPDPGFATRLRRDLLDRFHRDAAPGSPAADPPASNRKRPGSPSAWVGRRPWVATGVAVAGIVVVLALQAFGDPGPGGGCGGRPCPVPTTVAAVAAEAGSSLGTPLTTVRETTTTSSTAAGQAPATTSAAPATRPPTSRPATTAPPTTLGRPTTTRASTTTAPTTTAPTTTTTAAPGPT
jgi:RNA polymerase sigma-70 factor (ECF subfamily)